MESFPTLPTEQAALLLGSNANVWNLLTEATRQDLSQAFSTMQSDRSCGLIRLSVKENNDCLEAKQLRDTFQESVVTPLLAPHAEQASGYLEGDPAYADYKGTTGYVVGIALFQAVSQAFADSEAVQICFGLDKPIDQGGQIQLIFRGIGGLNSPEYLFVTATPDEVDPPDGTRVRPCPPNGKC